MSLTPTSILSLVWDYFFLDKQNKFEESEINILLEEVCEINKRLQTGGEINNLSN